MTPCILECTATNWKRGKLGGAKAPPSLLLVEASGAFLGTVLTPVPIPMDNGQRELAPDDLMLDAEAGSWTPQEFEEKYLSPNGENGGR